MEPIQIAPPEPEKTMACYDFDYTIQMLRQAIDFAEIEHDFILLRKWVNEVEQSGHDLEVMDNRLNFRASQEVLIMKQQSVTVEEVSPEEALLRIRC